MTSSPQPGNPPHGAPVDAAGVPTSGGYAAGGPREPQPSDQASRRLTGIDVARGLAILGMFVAHLGADTADGGADPGWHMIADGRSAALFAFLAGVSLALSTGRRDPPTGLVLARARLKIFYRAGLLLILGLVLVALGTPVLVILPAYAVMFVLALPFLAAARRWILLGAGTAAFVSPVVIFLLTTPLSPGDRSYVGELTGLADPVEIPMDVFATGHYAALIFSAYVLLGLAVGRSDLTSARFQAGMVAVGATLATVAWGSSRLLLDAGVSEASPYLHRLISGGPHEYSPVEVVGSCGTSLAVTGLLLLFTRPGAAGRVVSAVLSPAAAAGAMSLTVYSVQIVAIAIMGNDIVWYPESNAVLVWFIVIALAFAWLWRRFLGRGPIERLLTALVGSTTGPAPASAH
ncbi:hypothetical protein GCM10023169_32470 [Georgenia halophila]|uniref:Heparan-alpha-glucosaminide N-acetyltransferase catalytic domain-containing protein n=1 Tax=Georgenia halophila TaxID=620889 RepID=A0ABP8LKC0_9MICO